MPENNGKKTFYITTTLPYVNGEPHIGFATEIIRADIIARYKELLGYEVFFNTGTDEHGQKVWQGAEKEGISIEEYTSKYAKRFSDLKQLLNLKPDLNFIRTTDEHHIKAAQEFWKICDQNGYIYKKNYSAKYCVGCELEKTDSELVDGKCPLHPNRELEIREEENYFFKFSEFGQKLSDLYEKNSQFVIPDFRLNEIRNFVANGLQDFSISRQKTKMPWGIEVPGDSEHVMYVWFDALVNYISALGWPEDQEKFEKFWGKGGAGEIGNAVQYCGKDNLRQQSATWQAMLMSACLPATKNIVIDGFITGESGVKMSKSLGNSVELGELLKEFTDDEKIAADILRFYVCYDLHPFEDSPFTIEKFRESYNANLVNGLGNLVSRVLKMATTYGVSLSEKDLQINDFSNSEDLENFRIDLYLQKVWSNLRDLDSYIQHTEPFKKIKIDEEGAKNDVLYLLQQLYINAQLLAPVLPETSRRIIELIRENKNPEAPLFPRK